jgi:hypothetical protein
MSSLLRLALLVSCVLLSSSSAARADSYEWQRMERVLSRHQLELASLPEGKPIAWVRVVRDEVFVEDEVWPLFLNWFHMKTREEVVRRELLFHEDDAYTEARVEESMRNLRGMAIFALVRIVAVKTADPNAVGVLVHTRDLWSLRLETGFNLTSIVDQFTAVATERNFLGRNKALSAEFSYQPRSFSLSQSYVARRVWGTTVQMSETAGIIFNNHSKDAEGSLWGFTLGEPFYNLKQRFAWQSTFKYQDLIVRRLRRRQVLQFTDAELGDDGPRANQIFRGKYGSGSLLGYLRFGELYKQTWGLGWDYRGVRAKQNRETELVPELEDIFESRVLPRRRTEVGPAFTYSILMPQFMRFENLATFGQTENVRVGPHASLTTRVPLRAFGSNTNSWVFSSTAGFVVAPGGFLLEASVTGQTRYEAQRLIDQRLESLVRGATPVLFRWLRLVSRVTWTARRNDTANTFVALGASNGLRGYTSQSIYGSGASSLLANIELRTLPVAWQAVHVGGVVFYDTGTVYKSLDNITMHHAVGVGLRILFPQFNRMPFSLDAAAALDPPFRLVPTITDSQVVPLTAIEDPTN